VDALDRLREKAGNRSDLQGRPAGGRGNGVGGHHLRHHGVVPQPLDCAAGEETVRACDCRLGAAHLLEPVEQLDDGSAGRDLVVEHNGSAPVDVADDGVDDDPVVAEPALAAGGHWEPQEAGELRGRLRVAQVGRDDDGVGQVGAAEVVGQHADRREVVDGHGEEAVHLGCVQRHGQHPVGAGGDQHVSDQAAAEADPAGILLVAAGIGVVGDDRRDLGCRGPLGGVDHEQQLHERLLGGRHERLDQVDVALAAVRQQLGLQAVVAEPGGLARREGYPDGAADAGR
jgi:hypothetical protein